MGGSVSQVIGCRCSTQPTKKFEFHNPDMSNQHAWNDAMGNKFSDATGTKSTKSTYSAGESSPPTRKKHRKAIVRRVDTEVLLDWERHLVPEKNVDTIRWIHRRVKDNFMFMKLCEEQQLAVISRMVLLDIEEGTEIISSKEEIHAGDLFYLVADGEFEVIVNLGKKTVFPLAMSPVEESPARLECNEDQDQVTVVEYTEGHCFGDLNIYNGVTVRAKCSSKVWAVRLRKALKEATKKKEAEKSNLLKKIAAFKDISKTDLVMLVNAFSERKYAPGAIIVEAGAPTAAFHVIKSGIAMVLEERITVSGLTSNSLPTLLEEAHANDKKITVKKESGNSDNEDTRRHDISVSEKGNARAHTTSPTKFRGDDVDEKLKQQESKSEKAKQECKPIMCGLEPLTQKKQLRPGDYFGSSQERYKNSVQAGPDEPLITLEISHEHFLELMDRKKRRKVYYQPHQQGKVKTPRTLNSDKTPLSDLVYIGMLGRGAFGRVSLMWDQSRDKSYALKALSKYEIWALRQVKHIQAEKQVMLLMDHPFLVLLKNTYQDESNVYFLLEACLGGDLFTVLRKRRYFNEDTSRFYVACVVEAMDYLHNELNIAYRDLKPENLVLDVNGYLKVTDFGFAKVLTNKTFTLCGTPDYLAPEIVTGQGHDRAVDWWTLGILLYEMLSCFPPFFADKPMDIYRKIIVGKFKFPRYVSNPAKSLILGFLKSQPAKRLGYLGSQSVNKIRQHEFFEGFDWDMLRMKRMKAPIYPSVKHERDLSNFTYRGARRHKQKKKVPEQLNALLYNF